MSKSEPARILLVEDDEKLTDLLKSYFEQQNFSLDILNSGFGVDVQIKQKTPDLIILDLMLPEKDGLSICRDIRNDYIGKIIILTASDDDMDQVAALEMGVDDFVKKPIQPRVLLARIRMLLRRNESKTDNTSTLSHKTSENILSFNDLWINKSLQRCQLNSEVIPLTPSEFSVLWCLASQANNILSRDDLSQALRGIDYDGLNRTVDNKIAQLRKKLKDDATRPRGIITIRGKGYLFVPDYW